MAEKRSKALGMGGYKYTFLDKLVYAACLKRTQFIMVLLLLFELDYNTFKIMEHEDSFASVPDLFWNTAALLMLIFYEVFIGVTFLGRSDNARKGDDEFLSKNTYIMKIKPRIYYSNVWVKLIAMVAFICTAYLIVFGSVARTDFTAEKIEKYNILGRKTASYEYSEIQKCNISCAYQRRGKYGHQALLMTFTLPNGEKVELDVQNHASTHIYTASEIKSKLTNAKISYNEYIPLNEHIEWYGEYTEEEISMVYELFEK